MPSGHVRIGQCLKPQRQLRAPSNRAILRACLHCTSWSTTTSAAAAVMWSTTPAVSTPFLPFRFHDASVRGTAGRYNAPCGDPAREPRVDSGPALEGGAYDPTVDPDDPGGLDDDDHSSAGLRHRLVDLLRRRGHLSDDRIAAAFAAVPRELFLTAHAQRHGVAVVYRDEAIVTRRDAGTGAPLSSSSQPAIMAEMLEMAGVAPGQRVLESGAGTGYNAALLARLAGDAGQVTSV